MEISGFPRGVVHVSKGGCTCKQKGCTGRCSLNYNQNVVYNFSKSRIEC